jgi:hypothetical protein
MAVTMGSAHLFLAANTVLEKLQAVPPAFWMKVGIVVAALILFVILLRKLMNVNKFVLGGVIFIGGGVFMINMLYNRTEPKFLTPIFDKIAPFFPSAGAYETKQSTTPGK